MREHNCRAFFEDGRCPVERYMGKNCPLNAVPGGNCHCIYSGNNPKQRELWDFEGREDKKA